MLDFAWLDFAPANFTDPDPGDSLHTVKITALPAHGQLKLSNSPVAVNQQIAVAALKDLTYTVGTDGSRTDSFRWNGSDGIVFAANDAGVTLTIAPSVSAFTKPVALGTALSFVASDFTAHFIDPDPEGSLHTVKITALPAHGDLKLSGTMVTVNQQIAVENLGNLTYQRDAAYEGNDGFSWNGTDGVAFATTDAAVTLTITPTVSAFAKTLAEDAAIPFASSDFTTHFTDPDHALQAVKITTLPAHGQLTLAQTAVTVGQEIQTSDLGNLAYQGNAAYSGVDCFSWTGSDGVVYAAVDAAAMLTITRVDHPPVVFAFSKAVVEGEVLTFASGDFPAHFADSDPGDVLRTVKITARPSHGALKLSGTAVTAGQEIAAANLGNLTYEGDANWADDDSFSWKGSDGTAYSADAAAVTLATVFGRRGTGCLGFCGDDDGSGRVGFCQH